jgi:hypothetical protein
METGREVAISYTISEDVAGVRYRCHSPVPSGQSVRKLSEIPTLGSDRSGVGATPTFRFSGVTACLFG